jgi:general secretion pathway protein B
MPATVAASVPASVPADAPPLAVTGIAFNSDPESRMAVVNGLPVMPGTIIEGVKVEEILPDRVRFSGGGSVFEIFLQP